MQPPALDAVQRAVGDRYEVLGLVGTGGMGSVFRARHRTLGHIVAVKVLPPEVAASAMRQERFRREATLGACLDHPNIVRVYDFDTRNGITFLTMTFVRGDTFEDRLRSQHQTVPQVLRVVREIGDALAYAHRRGIVHRDVKPSNILIDEDSGRALLADFGIARADGAEEPSLTEPGGGIGTPGYMAPEQVGCGRVDGRADVYALAVVAFEAFTGALPPFQAQPTALARTLRAVRPRPATRLAAALVAPLAQRPDDRPATASAWLAQLDAGKRPAWRPWAAIAILAVSGAAVLRLVTGTHGGSCRLARDEPTRGAVMPFAVLGTPPYPARQLPEYFISRFRPVEQLGEVVSFGQVAAQIGTGAPSNVEARDLACRLGARFFVQGSVAFAGPTLSLTATLYEDGRPRRSGTASGRVGADESEMMDRVWAALYPEFTPSPHVTLPNGGPEAVAAYLNAEAAFRRGDYRTAEEEYTRVIRADTDFAIGRLRLALVTAHIDPTEQGVYFGSALRGAEHHQRGLSPADSLLLDGFKLLLADGDGLAALDRFKRATEQAPGYVQAWYVLGEFYIHFGGLFDQPVAEAGRAFNTVLDLDPRFTPAIAHLIALAYQTGNRGETADLIHRYLRIDSTSVVAEVVGIADTMLLGTAPDQLALLRTVCRHSFIVLEDLALQAAVFGSRAQREGPARSVLRCLERRGATDAERRVALRMAVAADLAANWPDSARKVLAGATGAWAAEERDLWILVVHAARVATLGDATAAADRMSARLRAGPDTDAVAHWVLARLGVESRRHTAALDRLAPRGPVAASLAADLLAQDALKRGDTTHALRLWDGATHRYAVMSAPFGLVASLWPLRLDMARVAVARNDTATAARACGTFETLIGYVDQVAEPEIERLCRKGTPG
jgi:serine/threonine protein kinase/tetratricopeptide (TPR) repeat protein